VALRVRSFLDTAGREHAGEEIVVVAHEVVVYIFRYVLERLTEAEVLALGRATDLANCSVTAYELGRELGSEALELVAFNTVPGAVPVTVEPDVPRAPR
jgi:broad specificity phosphatase PhoE